MIAVVKQTASALAVSLALSTLLVACGGGSDKAVPAAVAAEATPASLKLEKIGGFSTNQFGVSAAEIPAYDPASKRLFVVNAQAGKVDVLNLSDPSKPTLITQLDASDVLAGAEINSVAVHNGIVAVAIQASTKTDAGRMALYRASDLTLLGSATVGAQPDMITFTPDGKTVLTANEGEPSDDYQTDPEGSISIIDVSNPAVPVVRTAGFGAYNGQEPSLRTQGIRIYGPGASASQDFEPEYIAVSADGKTAWVTLQENNAIAKVDIATASVTSVVALGTKDHGLAGNELDASDKDGKTINIKTWPGVRGLYLPDSMASYSAGGRTYLVTANEGDARAWFPIGTNEIEDDALADYSNGNRAGFVEEFRVKYLTDAAGFGGRLGKDLPPQLAALGSGALLNPATFGYCGAVAGDPGTCRADTNLGRLNITWTMGYRQNPDGTPMKFNASGNADPAGDHLMYDNLYSYGARSFSIWDEDGVQVWDSGSAIEQFLASDDCKLGSTRNIPCKDFFNSGHDEGDAKDSRSDAKGPEPEGLAVGTIGSKTYAFVGLERMGGVLVYDITNPQAPTRVDYLNTREDWTTADPSTVTATVGDLGPEGLAFVPANKSPNGKPLLIVGNEVSGTTAVMQINLTY